jgi:glycosyltransferase involved in cell wall biosynthesis
MQKEIIFIAGKDPLLERGGHSSYIRAHARAAIKSGFDPHIFCVSDRTEVLYTDFGAVHRVFSRFRPFRPLMIPFHSPLLRSAITKYIRENKTGAILIHGFHVWAYPGVAIKRRLRRDGRKVRLLVNLYTTFVHELEGKVRGINRSHKLLRRIQQYVEYFWALAVMNRCERLLIEESDRIFVNYSSVRRLVHQAHGENINIDYLPYTSEKAFLNESCSDADLAVPAELERAKANGLPLIVTVSRHDPRKGLDVLIVALAQLRDAGIPFYACLTSGGQLFDSHQRLVIELKLSSQVILTEWVDDTFSYLRHADIFVLPSLEEGSGSVSLIEALQAGIPIIASNIDGIPEDVTDGVDALLVKPGEPNALKDAIKRLIEDDSLRKTLSVSARRKYEMKFSPDIFTQALRDAYEHHYSEKA